MIPVKSIGFEYVIMQGCSILVQAKMFMDLGKTDSQNFENAIRKYIKEFEFSNTVQNDLYQKMEEVGDFEWSLLLINIWQVLLYKNVISINFRQYNNTNY